MRLDIAQTARVLVAIDGNPTLWRTKQNFLKGENPTQEKCRQFTETVLPHFNLQLVRWDLIAELWEHDT